jgi:hypothetical protein
VLINRGIWKERDPWRILRAIARGNVDPIAASTDALIGKNRADALIKQADMLIGTLPVDRVYTPEQKEAIRTMHTALKAVLLKSNEFWTRWPGTYERL